MAIIEGGDPQPQVCRGERGGGRSPPGRHCEKAGPGASEPRERDGFLSVFQKANVLPFLKKVGGKGMMRSREIAFQVIGIFADKE